MAAPTKPANNASVRYGSLADVVIIVWQVRLVPLADVALAVDHRRKKQGNPKLSRVRNLPHAAALFLAAIHANGAPTHGPSGHASDADRR